MCPETIMIGMAIAGAAGSVMQGVAGYQAGRYNAQAMETQARYQEIAAGRQAGNQERAFDQMQGRANAIAGAAGLERSGSFADVTADNAAGAAMDADFIRYSGRVQAAGTRAQGAMERARGTSALVGGIINAGTSLVQGGDRWMRFNGGAG